MDLVDFYFILDAKGKGRGGRRDLRLQLREPTTPAARRGHRTSRGRIAGAETAVAVLSNSSRSVDAIGFRILEAINQSESAGTCAPQG